MTHPEKDAYEPQEAPCVCRACADTASAPDPASASPYESGDALETHPDPVESARYLLRVLDTARGIKGPVILWRREWPYLRAVIGAALSSDERQATP